jgi:hypothetical protein
VRRWLHLQPGWHRPAGLVCRAQHPLAACLLSPSVTGGVAPGYAWCALNPLMTKPLAPSLAAGMACALSESGDRMGSREVANAVIEAPCDTSHRVPRWTGGHR